MSEKRFTVETESAEVTNFYFHVYGAPKSYDCF